MTWTKHPDDYTDQLWSLGDAAYRLHCSATIFSNRTLSDGYVPADRVRGLMPRFRPAALRELLDAGRWQEATGGYFLADFAEDQPTRDHALKLRAQAAERKRRWLETHENGVPNGVPSSVPNAPPEPSRAVPSRTTSLRGYTEAYREAGPLGAAGEPFGQYDQ